MSIVDDPDFYRGTRPPGEGEVDPVGEIFASRSVLVHVVRGVLGLALVVSALAFAHVSALFLLLAIPGVVLWRGCPTCWTLGLIATVSRGRLASGATCGSR